MGVLDDYKMVLLGFNPLDILDSALLREALFWAFI
jgi:hypothetical protein